jgi:hypothetical protein
MAVAAFRKPDDLALENYLLGAVPEEDRERLDRASVEDDELAARLCGVENDLVDGYVRRTLPAAMARRFESHYLASLHRRERVRRARMFVAMIDRAAGRIDSRTAAERFDALRWFRRAAVTWTLPAAAVVAIVFAAYFGRPARLSPQAPAAERAASALAGSPSQQLEPPSTPTAGRPTAAPGHLAAASRRPKAAPRNDVPIALVLPPRTRAIGDVPTISLDTASAAGFEVQFEPGEFRQARAVLKDPATTRTLWNGFWSPIDSSADLSSVKVVIPAGLLQPRRYWLELIGQRADGHREAIATYVFAIAAP